MRLLIDGDIIARRAACSADSKSGGDQGQGIANYNAKSMLISIFKELDSTQHIMYLGTRGDRTQHRYKIYPQYKEHRKLIEYPKYLDGVRSYLQSEFDVEVVEGIEADDALSIEQYKNLVYHPTAPHPEELMDCGTCICSIDKDLLIVPGWNWNFVKKEKVFQSRLEGLKCFYKQIIEGDAADGVPRVRPKVNVKGKLALKKYNHDWIEEINKSKSEKEMLDIVRDCYYTLLYKDKVYHQGDIDKDILWRGQLLMPLKKLGELWEVPIC